MVRFPLSMAMLALFFVALHCTASEPDRGNDGNTHDSGGDVGGGGGGGSGDPIPGRYPASTARTEDAEEGQVLKDKAAQQAVTTTTAENKASGHTGGIDNDNPGDISSPNVDTDKSGPADSSTSSSSSSSSSSVEKNATNGAVFASTPGGVGKTLSTPSLPAHDPTSDAHSSSGTVSNHPPGGNNLDGSDGPERRAVSTDGTDGKLGAGSTGDSTHNTPTVGSEAHNPLASNDVPLSHSSTAGSGGSLTQSGLARDNGDPNTDSSTNKLRDQNKDQLQSNTGNQADNDASQKQGNTGRSPTSSVHTGSNKETQDKMAALSTPQKQDQQNTPTSEDVHRKSGTTNNNKQQTRNQGNAGTPTDPKTVSNVPSNKSITKPPKPEPVLIHGTESKMHSTTTTITAKDIEPISDANETSKTPTTTLAMQNKTLGPLQTLVKNDGSSSTPLLFAFVTLITLALVTVVPVS